MPARVVVLVSGAGSTLQALLDADRDPGFGAEIVAVGSDRHGIEALQRAERHGVPGFVCRVPDHPDRAAWDLALTAAVAQYEPDLVVSAGFMKLVGPAFLDRFGGRYVNSHPALLPSFPGMHGPQDALDYGVKVSGCTLFIVDGGIDTGPIIAQAAVPVTDTDDVSTLHDRIKEQEKVLLVEYVGRMLRDGWTVRNRRVTIP